MSFPERPEVIKHTTEREEETMDKAAISLSRREIAEVVTRTDSERLFAVPHPNKTAYLLSRLLLFFRQVVKETDGLRIAMLEKHALKDETGKSKMTPMSDGVMHYDLSDLGRKTFDADFDLLLSESIELPERFRRKINLSSLGTITSPALLETYDFIIYDDSAEEPTDQKPNAVPIIERIQ